MELAKWNPISDMLTLRNRINRMFDDPLFARAFDKEDIPMSSWNPAVDIYEDDDSFVVNAELPGVKKEDITIDLKDRVLTIRGERTFDNEIKEDKYFRRERFSGKFQRSFSLPASVDPNKIKAEYKDGVLNVRIPKPEEQKPKQITIS